MRMLGAGPTSLCRVLSASPTKVRRSSSMGRSAASASLVRMGESMSGPLVSSMSNGMPTAGSGVKMSLNRMTPSGRNAAHGCRLISTMRSVVSERSRKEGCFWVSSL